jgi:hypothetical protein
LVKYSLLELIGILQALLEHLQRLLDTIDVVLKFIDSYLHGSHVILLLI